MTLAVASRSRPSTPVRAQPLRSGCAGVADDTAIMRLFVDTLMLGRAPDTTIWGLDRYAAVCVEWYLREGRDDAAVAVDGHGEVVGYAFVCTDPESHRRHAMSAAARLVARVVVALLTGRLDRPSRRFYAGRLRDSLELRRSLSRPPMRAHAHLNVASTARSGSTALALRTHIDDRVVRAGLPGWFAEINARVGDRERALTRLGLEVIDRAPNRTLGRELGTATNRLTIVRRLEPVARTP